MKSFSERIIFGWVFLNLIMGPLAFADGSESSIITFTVGGETLKNIGFAQVTPLNLEPVYSAEAVAIAETGATGSSSVYFIFFFILAGLFSFVYFNNPKLFRAYALMGGMFVILALFTVFIAGCRPPVCDDALNNADGYQCFNAVNDPEESVPAGTISYVRSCESGDIGPIYEDCLMRGCNNGTCFPVVNITCTDSDNGINYSVRGNTSGMYQGQYFEHVDYCTDNSSLIEGYCIDDWSGNYSIYVCENGCENGACLPGPASIEVSSTPSGANVSLDGTNIGNLTAVTITPVTEGTHQVIISKEGYNTYTTTVDITPGETETINATLLGFGSISATSVPNVATVYVDGNYKVHTNNTIANLTEGNHTVRFTKVDYMDKFFNNVTVTQGNTTPVNAILIPSYVILNIFTPNGGGFYVDNSTDGCTNTSTSCITNCGANNTCKLKCCRMDCEMAWSLNPVIPCTFTGITTSPKTITFTGWSSTAPGTYPPKPFPTVVYQGWGVPPAAPYDVTVNW